MAPAGSPATSASAARYISTCGGEPSELAWVDDDEVCGGLAEESLGIAEALPTPSNSLLAISAPMSPTASTGRSRGGRRAAGRPSDDVVLSSLAPQVREAPSTRSAAVSASPAASAWRMASSTCPFSAYQRLARRCSSGTSSGRSSEQVRVEHVGEQVVVAVPAAAVVERDEEEVRAVQRLEHRLAVRGGTGVVRRAHGVAQRSGESGEDGGVEQEAAYVVGLAADDLVGEVVDDEPVVAGESGDERGLVVAVAQRDGGELERRHPALGAGLQRGDVGDGESEPVEVVEVRGDFVRREAEVGCADLDELSACPQPGQGQCGVGAGADDQP